MNIRKLLNHQLSLFYLTHGQQNNTLVEAGAFFQFLLFSADNNIHCENLLRFHKIPTTLNGNHSF
jgi:hypothetical protein